MTTRARTQTTRARARTTSARARLAVTLKYASLAAGCLVAAVPLLVVFLASLKSEDELYGETPFAPPANWFNLDNYRTAFEEGQMVDAFVNTTIILVISLTGTVLIGSMAAYAVSRFDFRGRRLTMFLFLLAALVPGVTTQVATFQVVTGLGLFNTRWAAIALFMGTDIISIYIFLQFLRGIPRSVDEAAMLDGATHWKIYRTIILPLLKPAIVTVVIVKGVAVYNEFYIPFLYMPSRDLGVVSTSLFRFQGPTGTQWEVISAGIVITVIPTLIVFLALQRYIYNGFTRGATK
ncbi:carbohydrate ABC transporter permease [Planobispora rosea]|uniref:carbohydrate ABC transporter permease n=1 Tax=Planobispora rosea TaxID=35762 RepID=UPI000839F307|nr:carbohydrate ABC transporter permease [Planobispora rosea]